MKKSLTRKPVYEQVVRCRPFMPSTNVNVVTQNRNLQKTLYFLYLTSTKFKLSTSIHKGLLISTYYTVHSTKKGFGSYNTY